MAEYARGTAQHLCEALKLNYFEWDAVMDETTPVERWARLLPRRTLLVSDPNTVLPTRGITAILRRSCPMWTYNEIADGGHMARLRVQISSTRL
jgi:hypothetical protein